MVVTQTTAMSLQAKQGLPRGNQIVGWIVLGTIRHVYTVMTATDEGH